MNGTNPTGTGRESLIETSNLALRLVPFHIVLVLFLLSATAHAAVTLPGIISDHMVLQRGMDAPLWGKASPGEKITVRGDWNLRSVTTTAGADGKWIVRLPTPRPGGPHTITIKGENEIVLRDILIGDVWICSGQSNMEMPVGDYGPGYNGVDHWEDELKNAELPSLRLFTVANGFSVSPRSDCEGKWSRCTAATTRAFSAVGFFFGRELHQTLKVPVALVSADFGGTVAEAWTSEQTLRTLPDFAGDLQLVANERDHSNDLARARAAMVADWTTRIETILDSTSRAALDDTTGSSAPSLGTWTNELASFDGVVWFRRTFELPPGWADRDLTLELGPVDDMDFTFVNGTKVGQTVGELTWSRPRVYRVPKGLLKPGTNAIAVCVLDTGGAGGISGPVRLTAGTDSLALNENWRYRAGAKATELPPLTMPNRVHANTASVLFNAMIAPLVPLGIRGVIWYQGESNIGRDEQYRRLFPALIADWRQHWAQGNFPFYYVQIAPFRYPTRDLSPALREAQFLSLRTPNTGMAVTMDSDSNNLHPHNKQAVGHRLALWALAKTYGRKRLVYSGPLYRAMKVEGDRIRLFFDHTGSGLTSNGQPLAHFTIAGADGKFAPAHAEIDGRTLVVWSEAVSKPVAVRYAWADAAESSFGNKEGLPASSFRTDAPALDSTRFSTN